MTNNTVDDKTNEQKNKSIRRKLQNKRGENKKQKKIQTHNNQNIAIP